jgi:hypothetical protein
MFLVVGGKGGELRSKRGKGVGFPLSDFSKKKGLLKVLF